MESGGGCRRRVNGSGYCTDEAAGGRRVRCYPRASRFARSALRIAMRAGFS